MTAMFWTWLARKLTRAGERRLDLADWCSARARRAARRPRRPYPFDED